MAAPIAPVSPVLDRSWWSWAGPHGGLLASMLLRAASPLAGDRRPRALTAQFLATPADGEVRLDAEVLREGGSSSVVRAAMRDGTGATTTVATLTSARHRPTSGRHDGVPAPRVPGPDECGPLVLPVQFVPFSQHVDCRPAAGPPPLSGGTVPELVAWVRLRAGGPLDAAALTILSDVMPPALYGATTVPVPVPTVELSLVFADSGPVEGWALARTATRTAADGWCVDDVEVWDTGGRLLVQGRQVRRVLGDLVLGGAA